MKASDYLSDGKKGSWGRAASSAIIAFTLLWITILVLRVTNMADLVPLGSFIMSCAVLVGVPYGLSKTGDTVSDFSPGGGSDKPKAGA